MKRIFKYRWRAAFLLRLFFYIGIGGSVFVAQSSEETMEKEKVFLVPKGHAVRTLKKAARQAGVDIVFSADIVKGVKTQSISGSYTPREAFELILLGTQLVAVKHEKSDVFFIKKAKKQSSTAVETNGLKILK